MKVSGATKFLVKMGIFSALAEQALGAPDTGAALFSSGPGAEIEQNDGVHTKVFFDIDINGQHAGQMIFGLFDQVTNAVENFKMLAMGNKGNFQRSAEDTARTGNFGFKGTEFHRIISGFMAQGGDFTHGDGTGGQAAITADGESFEDEQAGLSIQHTARGLLSMANAGPDTNGSQFFITFAETPWLNGKHMVIGQMLDKQHCPDCDNVLKMIEGKAATSTGTPNAVVTITDSGVWTPADSTKKLGKEL